MADVKVKLKGLENVKSSIKKLFDETRKDKDLLNQIGFRTVELFRSYNRAGKSPDGTAHRSLEESWIERKEELAKKNKKSEYFHKGAANMTFTGQLLDALMFKLGISSVTVSVKENKRTPYKGAGKKVLTNKQVADYLAEGVINKDGELKQRFVLPKTPEVTKEINNNLAKIVRTFLNNKIKSSIFRSSKS